ncbi:DMT family transporter [Bailinhaonella thermotolerans]|uniref:EamA family transporter n=1 Tax=Bailinhaonella thermotolerans TaxID=1070861 RepID=A0A3A4B911_9ACTN|nr:DMT family transporter [Bailinhaonella thermotolerans]RJL35389.1 EamA family transporter [Bailinhaonella thermotolerans]
MKAHTSGLIHVTVAAIAWGTGGPVAAVLYRDGGLGPLAVSFWRFALGALLLAALHPLLRRAAHRPGAAPYGGGVAAAPGNLRAAGARPRLRRAALGVLAMGAGLGVSQAAYFAAVEAAGVAFATVVTLGVSPVAVALGAAGWLGEGLGRRDVIALALAGAGLLLLSGEAAGGPDPAAGVLLALVSGVAYAGVTLLSRAAGPGGDPLGSAMYGFAAAGAFVLPAALAEGALPLGGAGAWAWLLFLGAVPTALAYTLYFTGLTRVRAATAAVVALGEPVVAALIAVAALGERLTLALIAGSAVLGCAVLILTGARR